eukprot:gene45580-56787_t
MYRLNEGGLFNQRTYMGTVLEDYGDAYSAHPPLGAAQSWGRCRWAAPA